MTLFFRNMSTISKEDNFESAFKKIKIAFYTIDEVKKAFAHAENDLGMKVHGYALSALQICRIEAGMIVPGWDTAGEFTDPLGERTPFELTLGWNVKLKREEHFSGKQSLLKLKENGPRFKMRGIKIQGFDSVEDGQPVSANIDGMCRQIGTLPSVTWHTAEDNWIGFASIESQYSEIEDIFILIHDKPIKCQICKLPFIKLDRANQIPANLMPECREI